MTNKPRVAASIFGSQAAAAAALGRTSGSGPYRVPKNGSVQVRFLTETDQWASYTEVYDPTAKRSRPQVIGEEVPPGATTSTKILAAVLLRDEERGDRVVPIKLAKTLAFKIGKRGDRYGTITDRDYILSAMGEGKGTEYDVDAEPPSKVALSKYEVPDLIAVLEAEAGVVSETYAAAPTVDDDDDDEDDEVVTEDDEDEAPAAPVTEDDDEDDDEVVLTHDDLKSMSVAELKSIAAELNVEITPAIKKSELIEAVWEAI